MQEMPAYPTRLWRRLHLGRSPLSRGWDRVETGVLVLAALLVLLAVPVAAAIGSETYARQSQVAESQHATRHESTAVLLADTPESYSARGVPNEDTVPVEAEWFAADGARRVGTISADSGLPAGTRVPIWLDDTGNAVDAPATTGTVAADAVAFAFFAWLGVVAVCAGLYWFARWALDRARYANWEWEWERVGTDWTHS